MKPKWLSWGETTNHESRSNFYYGTPPTPSSRLAPPCPLPLFFRLLRTGSGYERSLWHYTLASHISCFTWNLKGWCRKVVVELIFPQLACLWFSPSSSGPWGFLFQSDGSSAGPCEKCDFQKIIWKIYWKKCILRTTVGARNCFWKGH